MWDTGKCFIYCTSSSGGMGPKPGSAQGLLLALHIRIILGGAQESKCSNKDLGYVQGKYLKKIYFLKMNQAGAGTIAHR